MRNQLVIRLSELKQYYMADIKERNPEELLSYMMGMVGKQEELVEG